MFVKQWKQYRVHHVFFLKRKKECCHRISIRTAHKGHHLLLGLNRHRRTIRPLFGPGPKSTAHVYVYCAQNSRAPINTSPAPKAHQEKDKAAFRSSRQRQRNRGRQEQEESRESRQRWRPRPTTTSGRCSCSRSSSSSSRRPAPTRGARRATSWSARSPRSRPIPPPGPPG